jgi:hypothetical protein
MRGKHPLLRAVNSFFLRRLGAVIVLGDRLKSIYADVVPAARLHAVPNFAMDEFFVSPGDIDKKFECAEPLRLLFLSNLLPGKGHAELLAALSQLPDEVRRHLHVDFAGGFESAGDEQHFRKQAQAIKTIQINVHGIVHGEHKRELLRQAHLFCLPIQNNEFVRFLLVKNLDRIDRVAHIFGCFKPNCFDEASLMNQKTGRDSWSQHLKAPQNSLATGCQNGDFFQGETARQKHCQQIPHN